jgi:Ribosomal protein L11 methyltransferase (PrmA)
MGVNPLQPSVLLQRVPDVRLRLSGANTVRVESLFGEVEVGYVGLDLLQRLTHPITLAELSRAQAAGGEQQWMDAMTAVLALVKHGVVRGVESRIDAERPMSYGFDNPRSHIEMLDDRARTEAFVAAVEATVQPGDVVVDIGTGTGILAMAAARAGAARVYAIEAGAIADAAERVFAANRVSDRVTLVRGWSAQVSLPERADVLVTETVGSDPLDERILEIVRDARQRLLTRMPRIVPARIRVFGTAVEVPEDEIAGDVFTEAAAQRWSHTYGFDFAPLVPRQRWLRAHRVKPRVVAGWRRLAGPQLLVDLDLGSQPTAMVDAAATALADADGRLDAAVLHFELDVAPGISYSTAVEAQQPHPSWSNVVTIQPPVSVHVGDHLRLAYRSRVPGQEGGLRASVEEAEGARKH